MKPKIRRILLLVHPHHRPDQTVKRGETERDVFRALKHLGYDLEVAALDHAFSEFEAHVRRFQPHVVFNLLEEFRGEGIFDFHPVSWLEAHGIPFTGCNPRGLALTRNKFLTLNLAGHLGELIPRTRLMAAKAKIQFPAFLKYNREHASRGVTRANVVRTRNDLVKASARLRAQFAGEILAQDFIRGREVSIGIWGNARPHALPPWRLCLPELDDVATSTVKFSAAYRRKRGIRAVRLNDVALARTLTKRALKLYSALDMNGYARMDYRLSEDGRAFLIDVNANPSLARGEDFACAARAQGLKYEEVIERLITLALKYRPRY